MTIKAFHSPCQENRNICYVVKMPRGGSKRKGRLIQSEILQYHHSVAQKNNDHTMKCFKWDFAIRTGDLNEVGV